MIVTRNLTVPANGDDGIVVATDAYTDGDVVGGLLTFDVASGKGGGTINRVRLVDEDSQDEPYTLYLFNAAPTSIDDADPFAPTVADLRKLIAVVAISSAVTINTFDYWHSAVINKTYTTDTGKLYGYLVATAGTPDYTNADTLALYLEIETEG